VVFNIYCDSDGENIGGEYFEDAATLLLTITFFASSTGAAFNPIYGFYLFISGWF
jgi:hypothetical protein